LLGDELGGGGVEIGVGFGGKGTCGVECFDMCNERFVVHVAREPKTGHSKVSKGKIWEWGGKVVLTPHDWPGHLHHRNLVLGLSSLRGRKR